MKSDKLTLKFVILVILEKKNPKSTKIEFFGKINKYFLGSMSRSLLCENGPEIVEKKYTVAHSASDVTPRKKKFDSSGVLTLTMINANANDD